MTYNKASRKAEEFISHEEILATLAFAEANKDNKAMIEAILDRAIDGKGLDHREAMLLLECEDEALQQRMFSIAKEIKQRLYGNRIVMFAPLYLSNYCVNGCTYCLIMPRIRPSLVAS